MTGNPLVSCCALAGGGGLRVHRYPIASPRHIRRPAATVEQTTMMIICSVMRLSQSQSVSQSLLLCSTPSRPVLRFTASCWALIPWRAFFLAGEESAALRWHEMMKITATSIQDDALRRPNCAIIACCPNDPRLLELSLPHLRSRSCYYAALLPQSGYYQEFHVPKPNANRGRCGSGQIGRAHV